MGLQKLTNMTKRIYMKKEKIPGITSIKVDMNDPSTFPKSTINKELIDATTEEDIAKQIIEDELEAQKDALLFKKRNEKNRSV
jgi:hypothetical protein